MTQAVYPFPFFIDKVGKPLNGYLYFGEPNQSPRGVPKPIYWDDALTEAAQQPVRVESGLALRPPTGAYAKVFLNGAYSIEVQDKQGRTLITEMSANDALGSLAGPEGAGFVGFIQLGAGAVPRTMLDKAREIFSVQDFGAIGDGVTNNDTAFNQLKIAIEGAWQLGDAPIGVFFPKGEYLYSQDLNFPVPVYLFAKGDVILNYTGVNYAIKLGKDGLLNSPEAFYYQDYTVDGLRFTGGENALHGIYVNESIFEPNIRNVIFKDFGSDATGKVYCIFMQSNNWNALIENCRLFNIDRPNARPNFIALNAAAENGVTDGGNSRATIRDCFMTSYSGVNLGIFARLNSTKCRIVGGGFQHSSFGIFLESGASDTTIDTVYCEMGPGSKAFITHKSSGTGPSYQTAQNVVMENCYINMHALDPVPPVDGRVIWPWDADARLIGWRINNLSLAGITNNQLIVEQNNLTGQVGNRFSNIRVLYTPNGLDNGNRPNFPHVLPNVANWSSDFDVHEITEIGVSAYTLRQTDIGKIIVLGGASATLRIPATGTNDSLPVGAKIFVRNATGTSQTIAGAVGVTLNIPATGTVGPRTLMTGGFATLVCMAPDFWLVSGPGVA